LNKRKISLLPAYLVFLVRGGMGKPQRQTSGTQTCWNRWQMVFNVFFDEDQTTVYYSSKELLKILDD
jgi:hypothetical protein